MRQHAEKKCRLCGDRPESAALAAVKESIMDARIALSRLAERAERLERDVYDELARLKVMDSRVPDGTAKGIPMDRIKAVMNGLPES